MANIIESLKFNSRGLIPAVVQNAETNEVLMVAYMNAETIQMTLDTGKATFFSRSRDQIWVKGETSGNFIFVKEMRIDCDADCILLLADPAGPACHTGERTCFFRKVENGEFASVEKSSLASSDILARLEAVTIDRKKNPKEGSYTNYLFDKGEDKILKKVGEEAAEVVIAGKNRSKEEITYETADLLYHLTVMLVDNDLSWNDIYNELEKRR